MKQAYDLLTAAHARGVVPTIVHAPGAIVIVLGTPAERGDDRLSLEESRAILKLKTVRPIQDAIRAGELAASGKQRSRTIRRADLDAWDEARRTRPTGGVDDADIARRARRIEAAR